MTHTQTGFLNPYHARVALHNVTYDRIKVVLVGYGFEKSFFWLELDQGKSKGKGKGKG